MSSFRFAKWLAARCVPLALLLCPLGAKSAQVGPEFFGTGSRLVNFDSTPDGAAIPSGTLLGNLYSTYGVLFGDHDWVQDWTGLVVSPPNRADGSLDGLGPLDCYFPDGVMAVGAYGFDFVLETFDESDALIERVTWTDGTAGLFSANELGFLGISASRPIFHARFSRYWIDQWAYGFEIDNLYFAPLQPTSSGAASWGRIKSLYR